MLSSELSTRTGSKNQPPEILSPTTFDSNSAHQPQTASLADVFECHYLTRVAYETRTLDCRRSLRGRAVWVQQQIVLYAEDYFYRHFNPRTLMLYNSGVTRDNFHRVYGTLPAEGILVPAFPHLDDAGEEERRAARGKLLKQHLAAASNKLVVGYLGGIQLTKGYDRLIKAMEGEPDLFLLMGGPYSENFRIPSLPGRAATLGLVADTRTFYAACDVVVMPSVHETFGLVAVEAAARGTPVVVTPTVGAAPHLAEFGAGLIWNPAEPLGPLVRQAVLRRRELGAGAARMADGLSAERRAAALVEIWNRVAARRGATSVSTDH